MPVTVNKYTSTGIPLVVQEPVADTGHAAWGYEAGGGESGAGVTAGGVVFAESMARNC